MDNFLGTLIFLLPGFLMYFWLQSFGLNPVVKHTPIEFTTISALLWLPVSFLTLIIYNLIMLVTDLSGTIWNITDLKRVWGNFVFLLIFLILSSSVSFVLSVIWVKYLHPSLIALINLARVWRGMAPLSPTSSVWEEMFVRIDPEEKSDNKTDTKLKEKKMLLQISKIDKPKDDFIIGSMTKASRPYESDKALVLEDTEKWQDVIQYYDYPVKRVYIDIKSGLVVKELDHKNGVLKEGYTLDES